MTLPAHVRKELVEDGSRRLQPYPDYKDSGFEGVGRIPSHWRVRRLKFVAQIESGQSPASDLVTEGSDDLPFLQGNAEFGSLYPSPRQTCDRAPKRAQLGDVLLSVRAPVGAINVADQAYGIGRGLCAIRPASDLDRRYCFYLLLTFRARLNGVATGSTYDAVTAADVGQLPALLPELTEQRAIAGFLDRETAKIDALIAKKERLIELLRGRRAALVTRAVTRGLNSNAQVKVSGVEWLGEIPARWVARRLKALIADPITDGPHETPEFLNDGVPFLSVDGIQEGELMFEGCRYISESAHKEYSKKCAPRRDDILLGKAASTGKVARVKVDFEFSVWSPLAVVRPDHSEVRPSFLEYALKSAATQAQIDVLCTSNTQRNISMRDIPVLVLAVPELKEQRVIAAFLDKETARLDGLVAHVRDAIVRLNELRAALISAAVTGKFDVRGEAIT